MAVIEDTTEKQVHDLFSSFYELKKNDDKIKMSRFERKFIDNSNGIKILNTTRYAKFEFVY
jgi:hypothetical protein